MIAVRSGGSWSSPTEFAPYAGQTAMAAGGSGTPRVLLGHGDAVYEATGDERASKHYVAGNRVATRVDGELYYIVPDHLGSTTVVADATGAEVGRAIYDPYGAILTSTIPLTVTDRLFTGQRWDATIGLYDYNARFYDPQTGTFIQPDSIVPDPGNPIAWNRFAYVYNDPINNVDPSGHFVVAAIDTIWDAVDLYNDARDCFGDSDSMACYMAAAGVGFIILGSLEGPSNNVARRAAKAADVGDVGDAAGDVARRVDDVSPAIAGPSQARVWDTTVEFTADYPGGTGLTYKIYQRNDIDWKMVRTKGAKKGRGLTNAEAVSKYGLAPILDDAGNVATLHHSQQSAIGPLFEASTRYHHIGNAKRPPLHPFRGSQHPFFPLGRGPGSLREMFQRVDSIEYWKWRGGQVLGR
jgi:RHS repeat-associated protein